MRCQEHHVSSKQVDATGGGTSAGRRRHGRPPRRRAAAVDRRPKQWGRCRGHHSLDTHLEPVMATPPDPKQGGRVPDVTDRSGRGIGTKTKQRAAGRPPPLAPARTVRPHPPAPTTAPVRQPPPPAPTTTTKSRAPTKPRALPNPPTSRPVNKAASRHVSAEPHN